MQGITPAMLTDMLCHQFIIIAVLSGRLSLADALRATGFTPARWDEALQSASDAGSSLVQIHLDTGTQTRDVAIIHLLEALHHPERSPR